ncbi:MAG: TonB-dependent receptor, partial [Bacteroidota bacterium]
TRAWDDWTLNAGAQGQLQYRTGQNFENEAGAPGRLNFSDEIFSEQGFLYGQLRYAPGKFDLQADLSTSALRYAVDRTFDVGGNTGLTNFSTSRPVALRLAAGYRFGTFGRHYLYAARADGFSPPTLDEFRTNEGSLNLNLRPEVGTNYELGYRYKTRFVSLEAIGFLFALDEAITTFTDDRGTQLFRNAGRTRQLGVEITANHRSLAEFAGGNLSGLLAYTYYNFTYRDLARSGTDLSGQAIPGAAPHTLNLELSWSHPAGVYWSLFHNYTDVTPLNDANEVFAPSFHLMRLNLGWQKGRFDFFVSSNNLLNDELNLGYDLNVRFGGRYFQPAPGRTFLAGVRVAL